jgi:hypothetical protein
VDDGASGETAAGHSAIDQSLPTAFHKAKRVELTTGEKWKNVVEQKVPIKEGERK